MSYEGSVQMLCAEGHYHRVVDDGHLELMGRRCSLCNHFIVWANFVDETNDSGERDVILLDMLHPASTKVVKNGDRWAVLTVPAVYKRPVAEIDGGIDVEPYEAQCNKCSHVVYGPSDKDDVMAYVNDYAQNQQHECPTHGLLRGADIAWGPSDWMNDVEFVSV